MLTFLWLACAPRSPILEAPMSPSSPLKTTIAKWASEGRPETLTEDRERSIADLADWILENESAPMIFVCTHNSRRSHMSQLWAKAAAVHFGLSQVETYSGGTEATAFNPRAVTALRTHGFRIDETGEVLGEKNVVYTTDVGEEQPIRSFSKTYGDDFNPQEGFAAIMTCSAADAACPYVPGADIRISLPFIDPKLSDGTAEETATYLAKSEEIGREMVWLMQSAANKALTAVE